MGVVNLDEPGMRQIIRINNTAVLLIMFATKKTIHFVYKTLNIGG